MEPTALAEKNRGSEWRKWDLHVHTPESDGFSGTWEEFKAQLQNADCAVVGVNDYFSIVGYKKLKEEIENSTLAIGDKVILPVVEMRMTDSLQNRNTDTNGTTHFNFHIIFNDKLDIDDIESFIKSLESGDSIIGSDYNDKTKLKDKKVSFKETLKKLQSDKKFQDNFLIWLPYDEYGGIGEIDPSSDGWIKEDFIKKSHILGSSNQNQIDFFLWESGLKTDGDPKFTQEQFKKWFEHKKPCIKGSDSHSQDYPIGKLKDQDSNPVEKFCWIKADPTFEGLKQIVYEPEGRVKIQKENPVDSKKHWKLEKLIIENSKIDIFPDQEIVFNPYLTSVIGGRATGKSALVKIISFINGESDKFIDYIKEKDKEIKITLQFIDGDNDEKKFIINKFEDSNEALPVYYLSQEDIEKFSDEKRKEEHRKTFLETIGIDNTTYYYNNEKQEVENFIIKLKEIDKNEHEFIEYVDKLTSERKISFPVKTSYSEKAEKIIENLKKEKDKYSTTSTREAIEEISKRLTVANKIKAIQESDKIQKIKTKAQEINDLIQEYNNQIDNSDFKNDNYKRNKKNLSTYNINELGANSNANDIALNDYLIELRNESTPYVQVLKEAGIDYKTIQQSIESIDKTILSLETKKQEFETNQANKEKIFKNIVKVFDSYKTSIETSEKDIKTKFEEFTDSRGELFESIFEGITVAPQKYLAKTKLKNKFKTCCYADKEEQFKNFFDDLQPGNYFQKFDIKFLNKVIERKDDFKRDSGGYYSIIDLIYSDFIDNYLQIHPKIEFEGKELGSMSGGQQATLMLKLKLASEGIKKDIIILDQPENHLDNKFINRHLVDLIKLLKNHKQVIIVSHNANVVIRSDSEEIIIARMPEDDKTYVSGSIENDLINKGIVEVLEGGKIAFEQRKKRYNFN